MAIECILRLSFAHKKIERNTQKNKQPWVGFFKVVLVYRPPRSTPETCRGIICQALTSDCRTRPSLKRQERRKKRRGKKKRKRITHDSIGPAHLHSPRFCPPIGCVPPPWQSPFLCFSVFPARSCAALALIPGCLPPPPGSRIQSGAQMVASAEATLPPTTSPSPPSDSLASPPPPPPTCRRRREDSVFRVGTSWEKEEITGGCWAATRPDGLN